MSFKEQIGVKVTLKLLTGGVLSTAWSFTTLWKRLLESTLQSRYNIIGP